MSVFSAGSGVAWLTFASGVMASLVAAAIYSFIVAQINRMKSALRIEGVWGEFVPGSAGHRYTLGKIYYDKKRAIYAFDGTNYRDDGAQYCHFETIASHVDPVAKKYHYLFTAQLEGQLDKVYYGFGVVNLGEDATRSLIPVDGYYISASVDATAMSHSMIRATDIAYSRGSHGADVVKWIETKSR